MKTRTVKYFVKYRKNDVEKISERYGVRVFSYKNEKDLILQIMNDLLVLEIISEIISLEIELEKHIKLKVSG